MKVEAVQRLPLIASSPDIVYSDCPSLTCMDIYHIFILDSYTY